jgi:4'-phosphopantetheinyl transferase
VVDVEVWEFGLDPPAGGLAGLRELLSADERSRADRLLAPERWIAARGGLRILLGASLDLAPSAVEIVADARGKPAVPGVRLRFNLSHSGDLALVALADEVEVGVDVERLARRSAAVERTLSDAERAALTSFPDRHAGRLQLWCRKEAWAKATGEGLGWAPERFDTARADGYALLDLEVAPGYVGALAVAGDGARVTSHHLEL